MGMANGPWNSTMWLFTWDGKVFSQCCDSWASHQPKPNVTRSTYSFGISDLMLEILVDDAQRRVPLRNRQRCVADSTADIDEDAPSRQHAPVEAWHFCYLIPGSWESGTHP